jgi:hypothetical protein
LKRMSASTLGTSFPRFGPENPRFGPNHGSKSELWFQIWDFAFSPQI